MKTLHSILLIIISFTLVLSSCKKNIVNPLSQLPAATQTGANTFGCLVNGQAFVPHNRSIFEGPDLQCNYIYLHGGYYFSILAANHNSDGSVNSITIGTDSLSINQGQTIKLNASVITGSVGEGSTAGAGYNIYGPSGIYTYSTSANVSPGQLTITFLDNQKQIISGTFYFNVLDHNGDTVKITNGRFDMHYTQ